MPTLATDQDLAHTFPTSNEIRPWQRVQQYRRVLGYHHDHPDEGSRTVATEFDIPHDRVRGWLDNNSRPNPVRAIDTASEYGWLDMSPDSPTGQAWAQLVAWIYSGGTLRTDPRQPSFYIRDAPVPRDHDLLPVLEHALDKIGVGHTIHDRDGSKDEIQPGSDPILVGRMLTAMQAPVGRKRDIDDLRLPSWLWDSSHDTQRLFASVYLLNRGTAGNGDQAPVRFRVEWADQYHQDVADLYQAASDLEDGVTLSSHMLKLNPTVVDAILD
jgi:hypothetical protein